MKALTVGGLCARSICNFNLPPTDVFFSTAIGSENEFFKEYSLMSLERVVCHISTV
jgi:hypothetical protein